MVVQAFVAELTVEAFDVAVLHRLAGLDEQVLNTVALRPPHERSAGELRPVVGTHRLRIASKASGLIE